MDRQPADGRNVGACMWRQPRQTHESTKPTLERAQIKEYYFAAAFINDAQPGATRNSLSVISLLI